VLKSVEGTEVLLGNWSVGVDGDETIGFELGGEGNDGI